MLEAPHYTAAGARRPTGFALPADYFDGTVNEPVLHQAVRAFLNNQRQGTAQTKTRSFVSGGNQKPWKQKGTGRARQGSTRAPHWRGGGVVFGPQPRDYTTGIPRKVRQLARRSALNARARETGLHVVERLAFPAPKTRQLAELLGKLGVEDRKVLVLERLPERAQPPRRPGHALGRRVGLRRALGRGARGGRGCDHRGDPRGRADGGGGRPGGTAEAGGEEGCRGPGQAGGAQGQGAGQAGGAKKASARGAAKKPAPKKKKGE
jgi:large subunit ribosomal protein L4